MSVASVGVVTFVATVLIPVNSSTAGFAYLLVILIIASGWGFLEASIASVAVTVLFNYYFFPPIKTLTIADPQNWIALFTFLATSLIASRLSTAARNRTLDAEARQRDLERLYTFGRAILLVDSAEPMAKQLCGRLAETFQLSAVALYEPHSGKTYRAGPMELEDGEAQLQDAARHGSVFTDKDRNRVISSVRLGTEPIASLALQGQPMSDSVVQSIANLVAIGLEKARADEVAQEIEVTRRSDRLRTTLIDAMAHELKTPLTAVRAATSALLFNPAQTLSNTVELLKIADEEAAHLEELIDNALDVRQLDSEHFDVEREIADLEAVTNEAIASMKHKIGDRVVEFTTTQQLPPVQFDRRLIKLAIRQLLENALKYSPSASAVSILAFNIGDDVGLEITDHGKGIPAEEQARIFQRFYRSPSIQNQIPGSGLGLSIAYRIMQAHGGDLTVRSQPGQTTFRLTLPVNWQAGKENKN